MPHVILFVDDEPQVLELLGMTFPAATGYEALTAQNGQEALRILAQRQVDLLMTDQRMPGMTGIELISRARSLQPDLCAILLTGYTDPRDIVDAINQGEVYRYLTKPWETSDLRQTVVRALEQVHLKREKARLYNELERRFAALSVASEIARDVGRAGGVEALVERLLSRLPGIVPCDVAAALVVPPGSAASLVLMRPPGTPPATLLDLKDDTLAAWATTGASRIAEEQLRIHIIGEDGMARLEPMRSRLVVPLQIDGQSSGLLVLESAVEDDFNEGDARVLDMLANELAGSLRALAAKLSGERRRLERIVECMADGLLFVDSKSEEVVANPAARRMLHTPEMESLTTRWLKETLGFYPFDLVRGIDPTSSGPTFLTEELRLFDRTLSSIVSPVIDENGQVAGVAVAMRDVTEQKLLEARKEEFVQIVSHELRTPLTSITGALDLVLGGLVGEVSPKQVRYLKMARDSTEKLNAVADDLLDLARFAKGKLQMEVERVYLGDIVQNVAERYCAAAPEKGLEIELDVPPEPIKVVADAARISQVLANLFTNAVKFTPDHGRIEVTLFGSPAILGWAGISVWNNGEPIAESDLERIFDKFEQARTERTRRVRGTGLGLAICRSIVETHGGRIWAESAPAEGVRFTLVLPPEPPPEGQPAPAVRSPNVVSRPVQAPVLVIDDPQSAAVEKGILLRKGFSCVTARPGTDSVALAKRLHPRLILLDPRTPGIDSAALVEGLRRDPELRAIPLMVFSVSEEREAAFQVGASAFLAKPAPADELSGAVEVLLSGSRHAGHRVLVVDDDSFIRAICSEILGNHGYEVHEAATCTEAMRAVRQRRPHLILVDVQLPDGDGFSLLEGLQEERAAEPFAAVFLSARGQTADKVRGFRLGADDYLSKPFDALELVARVDAVLRRRESTVGASPITRLPSGRAIEQEVRRRLEARVPFAFCYLDLDNFKEYNDHYGYAKADGLLRQVGDLLRQVVASGGGESAFVGHVGGDDFVFMTADDRVDETCRQVVAGFDRLIPLFYEREDRERGHIEAEDRFGVQRRYPIMSVSVVAVWVPPGRFERHAEIARAAAELKKRAKAIPGSIYLKDTTGENTEARAS